MTPLYRQTSRLPCWKLSKNFATIVGRNRHIEMGVLTGAAQINRVFEEDLALSLVHINPLKDLKDEDILNRISNSRGIELTVLISEVRPNLLRFLNANNNIFAKIFRLPIKIWFAIKSSDWKHPHSLVQWQCVRK